MMTARDYLHTAAGRTAANAIAGMAGTAARYAQSHAEHLAWLGAGRVIDLIPGSMCARFARQVHEAAEALDPHEWAFAAATAVLVEERLRQGERALSGTIPGCLLFWDDGKVGHVAVYVGSGMVAENTGSQRGAPSRPGTKLTTLADVARAHGGEYGRSYWGGRIG